MRETPLRSSRFITRSIIGRVWVSYPYFPSITTEFLPGKEVYARSVRKFGGYSLAETVSIRGCNTLTNVVGSDNVVFIVRSRILLLLLYICN